MIPLKHSNRSGTTKKIEDMFDIIYKNVSTNLNHYSNDIHIFSIWSRVGNEVGRFGRHDTVMPNLMNGIQTKNRYR